MPDIIDPRTRVAHAARPCIPSVFICAPSVAPSSPPSPFRRFVASPLQGHFGVISGSVWGRLVTVRRTPSSNGLAGSS